MLFSATIVDLFRGHVVVVVVDVNNFFLFIFRDRKITRGNCKAQRY